MIRVFPMPAKRGLMAWRLRVSGAADLDIPMRFAVIPRGEPLAYSVDLDGDGQPEWILENPRARAVFSSQDGGRWLEFVWKDSGLNVLPENGALAGTGAASVQLNSDGVLEFRGNSWRRLVHLATGGASLTVEQSTPLPPETLRTGKKNDIVLHVTRESPEKALYSIDRPAE